MWRGDNNPERNENGKDLQLSGVGNGIDWKGSKNQG